MGIHGQKQIDMIYNYDINDVCSNLSNYQVTCRCIMPF